MKNAAILILAVLCLALAGCQSDSTAPPSVGTIEAHADTIKRIADQSKPKAASPEDATAFGQISDEATAIQAGIAALEKTVNDLQTKLKNALDTAKLRDSVIFLVPAGIVIWAFGFAFWGYSKSEARWAEYAGLAGAGMTLGASAVYLAIQTIQTVIPWLLVAAGAAVAVVMVYLFIKRRTVVAKQLVTSTQAAINMLPPEVQPVLKQQLSAYQSPATKAVVDDAQKSAEAYFGITSPILTPPVPPLAA